VSLTLPFLYGWSLLETPIDPTSYAAFFLPFPTLLMVSALLLLFRRMSLETRGILGFIVFVLSIITPVSPYIVIILLSVILRHPYTS